MNKKELEETLKFNPKFDDQGLIPCVCTCHDSGDVLMFAFMNKQALLQTLETGEAHYYSRSRRELWHKGATSGKIQKIVEIRTDCDQDCIWIKVKETPSCHTGRKTCFYRKVNTINDLGFIDNERLFDPNKIYKK